jgi:hypothetical protein
MNLLTTVAYFLFCFREPIAKSPLRRFASVLIIYCSSVPVFAAKPSIISQPTNQTVVVGLDATFTVVATGTEPLNYQWRFNGTSISAATNTSFTITGATVDNAGSYSVIVANHPGSVASSNAVLSVGYAPFILEQPISQVVLSGSDPSFTVLASGSSPLFYRWQFNGLDLIDATNATFIVAAMQPDQAGVYTVIITNNYGSVKSSRATLTVVDEPIVIDFESLPPIPGFISVGVGDYYREKGFVLSVLRDGLSYFYWETNSANYPGSTALFINNTAGNYACLSRGDGGSFDLASIDLSTLIQGAPKTVTLIGYDGVRAVCTFQANLGPTVVLKTFYTPGFTNLTEVRWQQTSESANQFDNIVVFARDIGPPSQIQIADSSQFNSIFPLYLTHLRVETSYIIDKSLDLVTWQPWVSFKARTSSQPQYDFYDPAISGVFYRMRPAP